MIGSVGMSNNYVIPISNVSYVTPANTDNTVDSSGKVRPVECQTCKNRRYQDGSNEMVSFKSPGKIRPEEAYAKVHKIWTAANAGDKVKTEIVPGMEHAFPAEQQKAAFDWLDKQLK